MSDGTLYYHGHVQSIKTYGIYSSVILESPNVLKEKQEAGKRDEPCSAQAAPSAAGGSAKHSLKYPCCQCSVALL